MAVLADPVGPRLRISRSDFKHPKLKEWVVAHRSELLGALITFVKHWPIWGVRCHRWPY